MKTLSTILLLLCVAGFAVGQTPNTPNTESSIDSRMRSAATVNPATQALQMQIPLGSYQGRGGMSLPVMLSYSSKVWNIKHQATDSCDHPSPQQNEYFQRYIATYGNGSKSGWTSNLGTFAQVQPYSIEAYNTQGQPTNFGIHAKIARMFVTLPDGSRHELRKDDIMHDPFETITGKFYSVDGSRLMYDTATSTLYMPDGMRIVNDITTGDKTYIDRNGNEIKYSASTHLWTDTLGRTVGSPLDTGSSVVGDAGGTSAFDQTYTIPGFNGGSLTYTLKWKQLTDVRTDPSQPLRYKGSHYKPEYGTCGAFPGVDGPYLFETGDTQDQIMMKGWTFNPVVLAEIVLPNGTSYKFTYNVYGEIDKVAYPTGAYDKYTYGQVPTLTSGLFGGQPFFEQGNRGVYYAKQSEDGTTGSELTTSYNVDGISNDHIITAPDGSYSKTLYYTGYNPYNVRYGFDDVRAGTPYDTRTYTSSGVMTSRHLTETAMTSTTVNPYWSSIATKDPHTTKEVTAIFDPGSTDALVQMTSYEYDSNSDPEYRANLNVKRVKQYGYVVVPKSTAETATIDALAGYFNSQTPVRITETDYLYDANYKARGIIGLVSETRVIDPTNTSNVLAKSQFVYDETAYFDNNYTTTNWDNPKSNLRGNVTTTKTWVKDTNSWIESHAMFDNFGNIRKIWDTSDDPTRFVEVEYSPTYNYAYPNKTKAPAPDPTGVHGTTEGSEISRVFDFNTGLMLSVTDANGQTATTEYDNLLRPIRVNPPAGGSVSETIYNDTPGNLWVKRRQQIDEYYWAESTTYFDNLGRAFKSRTKDLQGDVVTEIRYDSFGRVKATSNPYRVDASGNPTEPIYWSKPRYDELNRVVETYAPALVDPNSSAHGPSTGTVQFGISTEPNLIGAYTVATDASGRKSRSVTGIYGLMRVDEATSIGGTVDQDLGTLANPNQPTSYTYNIKGELVKITQGKSGQPTQYRYFAYDSLGRLIRVRQPEQTPNSALATTGNPDNNSWTSAFTYDVFGNVISMTDAKNTTITNEYDKVSRPVKRTYTDDTPQVEYFYDGKGLPSAPQFSRGAITKVSSSVSEDRFTSFDNQSRLLTSQQITDGQTYGFEYKYNLSGGLVEETYPSGRVTRNYLDSDGGLGSVTTKAANGLNKIVASNFDYSATGDVRKMKLGNGLWETAQVNERLQLMQIGLGTTQTDKSLFKVDYEYGELSTDGASVDTSKNIGMIARTTTTIPTTSFVQPFKYDSINRLTEAKETTGGQQNWQQTFDYDRFGNRTSFTQVVGTTQLPTNNITKPTIDQTNNRFTTGQGYVYDFNGNLIQDAEGRSFTFNGDDKQTEVRNSSNQIVGQYFYDGSGARVKKVVPSTGETTIFVYDAGGALAAEYSTQVETANPQTSYLTTDHLGSPRVITDKTGNVIARRDFMPFGEELGVGVGGRSESQKYSIIGSDNIRKRFTGYEKDDETGLDFAEARMYQNKHGRFTAVDPLLASASATNPQTFNRYAYTGNNPVNYTDPSGLDYYRDANNQIKWFKDNPGEGWTIVTGTYGQVRTVGPEYGRAGAQVGSIVFYQANSIDVIRNPTDAQVAAATGTQVVASQSEIISTSSSELSLTISQRQVDGLPPCPVATCGSVTTSAPSLDMTNVEGSKVVEGIARIGEAGSVIPGLGSPLALVAAFTRAGQGNFTEAAKNLAFAIPLGAILGRTARGINYAREVGMAGERAAGITGAKKAIEVGGRKLFPDEVTRFALTEVKNVKSLSFTRQLRDYSAYSQSKNLKFFLVTRPGTKLSGPLKMAIENGSIIHRPILPF